LSSCKVFGPDARSNFELWIFDPSGSIINTGSLDLDFSPTDDENYSLELTGAWSLSVAQCGGRRQGSAQGRATSAGVVYISLDDRCVDSGLLLEGRFESTPPSDFSGVVYSITIAGPIDDGKTFAAKYR
jgi:hypothetical protein